MGLAYLKLSNLPIHANKHLQLAQIFNFELEFMMKMLNMSFYQMKSLLTAKTMKASPKAYLIYLSQSSFKNNSFEFPKKERKNWR